MRRRDGPLLRRLVLILLLLLLLLRLLLTMLLPLAHVADAPPHAAAALSIAGGHQLQDLLRALLARPEPARRSAGFGLRSTLTGVNLKQVCTARHPHWQSRLEQVIRNVGCDSNVKNDLSKANDFPAAHG